MSNIRPVNEPRKKVVITVPVMLRTEHSKKYDRQVTRGWYLNVKQALIKGMGLKHGDLVKVTIERT